MFSEKWQAFTVEVETCGQLGAGSGDPRTARNPLPYSLLVTQHPLLF